MLMIIRDGGVVRMDDLHVDKIDEAWKPRECWVQSGLEAFRIALMLRDRHHLPFTVALGFSLESGEHFRGINFRNTAELVEQLNWVPSSLYIFEPGKTPRTNVSDVVIRDLESDFFGPQSNRKTAITSGLVNHNLANTTAVCSWKGRGRLHVSRGDDALS